MTSATPFTNHPSWLFLSIWLVVWSWIIVGSKDRSGAANAQMSGLPPCVSSCGDSAASTVGCRGADVVCICNSASFFNVAEACMAQSCTSDQESSGLQFYRNLCRDILSTTPSPNPSPSSTSTSITSVPPPATSLPLSTLSSPGSRPPVTTITGRSTTVTVTRSGSFTATAITQTPVPGGPSGTVTNTVTITAPGGSGSVMNPSVPPSSASSGMSSSGSQTLSSSPFTIVPGTTSTITFRQPTIPPATPTGSVSSATRRWRTGIQLDMFGAGGVRLSERKGLVVVVGLTSLVGLAVNFA
ncbi:hypothetical protein K474DRAFT_1670146 [Panus rudis PR-1116 ss-1]|nr:hypothetical protein K474DRAFT_1670146 [Panus rudis PR-1116 ss-1]